MNSEFSQDSINLKLFKKFQRNEKLKNRPTDEQLKESYQRLGNIWKVAEEFEIVGQTVYTRLRKIGCITQKNYLTNNEESLIKLLYIEGFERGDGKLDALCKKIGRTKQFISRFARQKNFTNISRKRSKEDCERCSIRSKKWHKNNPHPRGMLGKRHSKEYCKQISERVKKNWYKKTDDEKSEQVKKGLMTRLKNYGTLAPSGGNVKVTWKQGWRIIGGKEKYFRSRWEANYARYLEFLKVSGHIKDWFHEPETFWFHEIKRGTRTYLPDFKVIEKDDSFNWIEVKGYMDDRSLTKIKRFRKYYPQEKLKIINGKWFEKNNKKMKIIIKDWE